MAPRVFLGYGSEPKLSRESLHAAAAVLTNTGVVQATSWEDLRVAGRVIIKTVLREIDSSNSCLFDLSTMNENVLFELGYAIAKAKPVMLLLDQSDAHAKAIWKEFRLLKQVGYTGWTNADDIRKAYLAAAPHDAETTLYDDLIEPELETHAAGSIFFVPTYHATDAAKQIDRRLNQEIQRGIRLLSSDPTESSLNTLGWYANKAYETDCSIIHFESPRRELASLHNPRSALVAGIAVGMERPLLMIAEEEYSPPLDYEGLLRNYSSARECSLIVDEWLREQNLQPRSGSRTIRRRLTTELRTLRFGEHVAENEIDYLSEYFVETAGFEDVVASRDALFVGRKGTGKTANMLQAAARLSEDARNLVVVIKPASYEFASLLAMLANVSV
ncbi:MAG: hypothetical protein QOK28_3162, partial [Actinomycetota bacterium]